MTAHQLPFHPLADIFPLLDGADFRELVEDIRTHGLREPVIILDGAVLDGRNRLRACEAAQVPARFQPFDGADPVAFVISMNLRRRHLNESQRAMVAAKLANLPAHRPAEPVKAANLPGFSPAPAPVSQSRAADMLNVSERSVRAAKEVRDHAVPEIAQKVERGELSVSAAAPIATLPPAEQKQAAALTDKEIVAKANAVKRRQKAERQAARTAAAVEAAAVVPAAAERYTLHHASFTDGRLLPAAASVDVIVTDPPYPAEFLDLFGALGEVAGAVLKPGGLAVVMVGQTYLPDIIQRLGRSLTYHWTLAYLTPGGQASQQFPRRVNAFWKPVLIYSNGEYAGEWFGDVAKSDVNDNDKAHHHWGQSVSGMRDLMKRFVRPGNIVMDPFLGGGTTALVALELGASFVGFDIDENALVTTRARIGELHAAMVA